MAFPLGACSFFGRVSRHRNRLSLKATLPMQRTASPSGRGAAALVLQPTGSPDRMIAPVTEDCGHGLTRAEIALPTRSRMGPCSAEREGGRFI
jgi:hypothetical protein